MTKKAKQRRLVVYLIEDAIVILVMFGIMYAWAKIISTCFFFMGV